jgi:very-short-patch-repair endonuclease
MDTDEMVELYTVGMLSASEIAAVSGMSKGGVTKRLKKAGVTFRDQHLARRIKLAKMTKEELRCGPRIQTDDKLIRSMYLNSKLSEQAIARKLGVSRSVIRRRLSVMDIRIRTQGESQAIRMKKMTADERKKLTSAANKTVRGTKQSDSTVAKRQRSMEGWPDSSHEILAQFLFARSGIALQFNQAIGRYRIDLCDWEHQVAIEINSGHWHTERGKQEIDRRKSRFLLNRGWTLFVINRRDFDKIPEIADAIRSLPVSGTIPE